jgi:acetylornithine deacetylase/succinyl-diaminopimelate desuccinylase-like protein
VTDYAAVDALVADRLEAWTEELAQFCRLASEEGDTEALAAAADWTAERLRALGAEVEIVDLEGAPPLVVGEIGEGPVLNLVQHYDVQPSVPLDLWTTPPYEPDIRDGRLFARGATDNKGELMPRIWGVEAYLEAVGPLPCRVRFLVEGEEESGSHHLDDLLDLRPHLRKADGALIEGGGLDMTGRPGIAGGGRGMLAVELIARTISHDAHSSLSMVLPSAAIRMVRALASLYDERGLPAIEGLDAGARPPTAAQLAVVDAQPVEQLDDLRHEFEVERFLGGRDGIEAMRAMTFETTCNIQGLWSGYTGPGDNTIVPAEAHARLDIRLVPDQDPEIVRAALRRHLDRHGFADIEIESLATAYRAYWTAADHPILAAATRVSEEVTGKPAIRGLAFPGTVPMWQVCGRDGVPQTTLGAGRDDCRAHAPDENVRIEDLATATRITARFLDAFAELERQTAS